VIVTDDNPRSENPVSISAAIMDGASRAPHVGEVGDRREAIHGAIAALEPGDVLLIAGKGHETGQIVGGTTLDFSDHEEVGAALREKVA
jgi:UDP-N-acetylmuramoyl-L-alanyl-D-glutamate--2,6-diaminopimelate ligase